MLDGENSCIGVQSATHEEFLEPENFYEKSFPSLTSNRTRVNLGEHVYLRPKPLQLL